MLHCSLVALPNGARSICWLSSASRLGLLGILGANGRPWATPPRATLGWVSGAQLNTVPTAAWPGPTGLFLPADGGPSCCE